MDISSYVGILFYQEISNNDSIVDALSTYGSEPAIFHGLAPHDVDDPYITFTEIATPDENSMVDRVTITVDIFDDDGSPALVKRLGAEMERIFDQMRGGLVMGMWRDYAGMVVEDNPNIQHLSMIFVARLIRQDLVEIQSEG